MDERAIWRTEPGGGLSAEVGGFRLVVEPPREVGGWVRFVVLRRETGDRPHAIAGSGNERGVCAAMATAERMARRFAAHPFRRGA